MRDLRRRALLSPLVPAQRPVSDGYLAVAMLIGAFAEIHFYFYPGVYGGLVTTSEALRLAFFVVLLLGINAESRSDLRALRSAYAALDRLRLSEAERATLEERTRLARELHDGLAQDLWFAKLKHERLVAVRARGAPPLAGEVSQALDSAIAEAKQAVRHDARRHRPRACRSRSCIARAVDDFGGRSGVRADSRLADLPTALPPRTQVEVLRVLQEALTNVGKHADATVVRVSAEVDDGDLFGHHQSTTAAASDPEETSGDGLGVQGMKERARLMGGDLRVIVGAEWRHDRDLAAAHPDWSPTCRSRRAAAMRRHDADGSRDGIERPVGQLRP